MKPGRRWTGPAGGIPRIRADDIAGALAVQEELRHCCTTERAIPTAAIRTVAGADAAYAGDRIFAVVVVLSFPALEVMETARSSGEIVFPYIPGLLSFREGPAILDAWSFLETIPDLLILNGHGIAHPRRFGLASHVGLVLGIPTIGVAKRLVTGTAAIPGPERGAQEPVYDGDEVIGMAVRTVPGATPVFVSPGYKVDLIQAVDVARSAAREHRITEPVWHADRVSRQCRDRKHGT